MSTFYGTAGKDVVQAEETPHDTFYGLGGGDEFYISTFGGGGYYFYGGDGNDRFSGGATVIWMADGGAGDDRFDLNGEYMRIEGGTGNDRIEGGADSADVFGGDGNDFVDVLSYPDQGDTIDGGAGNDTLLVGSNNEERDSLVAVRGGAGDDTIAARSDRHPGLWDGIDANGGDGRDVLTGPDDPDAELSRDLLYGGAGDDRIHGRRGDDKLGGDGGVDTLTGGGGRDVFDFNPGGSGVGAGRRDVVADFAPGQDALDLLSIDANAGRAGDQAFAFVGTRAFTGAGQLRMARADGDTVVQGSTDGDAQPEFEILLANGATPAAGDFLL